MAEKIVNKLKILGFFHEKTHEKCPQNHKDEHFENRASLCLKLVQSGPGAKI